MPDLTLIRLALFPISLLFQLALILSSFSSWPRKYWRVILAAAVVWYLVRTATVFAAPDQFLSWDFRIFYDAGKLLWAGGGPLDLEGFKDRPVISPPTVFPIFLCFASLPYHTSELIWFVLNTIATLALVWTAVRLVAPNLPISVTAIVASAILSCNAAVLNTDGGQMAVLTALVLTAALLARQQGYLLAAGALLAVATIKIGTALPFLLLFLRRRDLPVWIALATGVLVLIAASGRLTYLPADCFSMLARIGDLAQTGAINDFSYSGKAHHSMVGIDHAAYRVGFRNVALARGIQAAALLVLGTWVAIRVVRRPLTAYSAALVSIFAVLFLYHRIYDLVLLTVPVVYALGRIYGPHGGNRRLVALVVFGVAGMNLARRPLEYAYDLATKGGLQGYLLQALILPIGTWLVLGMLALLLFEAAPPEPVGRSQADLATSPYPDGVQI